MKVHIMPRLKFIQQALPEQCWQGHEEGAVRALILQREGLSLSGCQLGWVEGVEQHSSMSRMKIRLMRLTRIVGLVVGVGTIKDSHFDGANTHLYPPTSPTIRVSLMRRVFNPRAWSTP